MDKNTTNNLNIHSRKAGIDLKESSISCPVDTGFSVGNDVVIRTKISVKPSDVKKWIGSKGTI